MNIMIGLVGVLFLAMGLSAMAAPVRFLKTMGCQVLGRDGRSEVRAVYGGFGICIAALLGYVVYDDTYRAGVLLCAAVALAGMAAGRVVSATIDRGISPLMIATMLGEAVGASALYWATGL